MRQNRAYIRILTLILCFAMVLQSGFVMPVFAEGTSFYYSVTYNSADKITEENNHYVIVPDEDVEAGPQDSYTSTNPYTTDTYLNQEFDNPFRILGYTFNGWITSGTNSQTVVFENSEDITPTIITDDFPIYNSYLDLYGDWEEYGSPIITSGTVQFGEKNAYLEKLEDSPEWYLDDTSDDGADPVNIGGISNFDSEKSSDNNYEYSTYVYNSVDYVNLTFEQFEPQADTKVYINDEEVDIIKKEPIYPPEGYGTYYIGTEEETSVFKRADNIAIGYTITTADMPLHKLSEGEDNQIKVVVSMQKDAEGPIAAINNSRTYIFNVKRIQNELRVEYGNTPYGTMYTNITDSDQLETQKERFQSTWSYGPRNYSQKAWNIFGDDGTLVDKGSVPDESKNEYINYDMDNTAMVVSNGQEFIDRGVSDTYGEIEGYSGEKYGFVILDENGSPVKVDSSHTVTRTIVVDTVVSLKYPWTISDTNKAVEQKELKGTEGENVVNVLTTNRVKPGIYKIKYTYTPDGSDFNGNPLRQITATKNLVVIPAQNENSPSHFDLNMDNYINALDTLMYDVSVADNNSISENLYRYRALDVYPSGKNNGFVDDYDKQHIIGNEFVLTNYSQEHYQVAEDSYTMQEYTPSTADSGKAQLYMDFLGYNSAAREETVEGVPTTIPAHDDTEAVKEITDADSNNYLYNTQALSDAGDKYKNISDITLWPGNTVFLGYRFDNLNNLDLNAAYTDLKEITLTINYDTRYMQPQAINANAILNHIREYNPELAEKYSITVHYDASYETDRSTAKKTWNNQNYTAQVKTLKLEMYLKDSDGEHLDIKTNSAMDNVYFLKLPFRIINVPLESGRCAISTQLSANALNLAVGAADDISQYNGYMWDNSSDTNHDVTAKLNDNLQYMGDFVPNFVDIESIEARALKEATYGYAITYTGLLQAAEIDGNLPDGLTYNQANGQISGTPTKAQDEPYVFYVNGTKYSIKVNKAPLTVTADDKTKIYGDGLETVDLTYTYTASDLRNGDYIYNGKPYAAADTAHTQTIEKSAPEPVCDADEKTVVQSGYEIGFNETGLFDNYELTYVPGSLDITQRVIRITNAYVPSISISVFETSGDASYVFPDLTTAKINDPNETVRTFEVEAGNIVNDDKVTITYVVTYPKPNGATLDPAVPDAETIISDIRITNDEWGRNYKFADGDSRTITTVKGIVVSTILESISPETSCQIEYTYGTPLNLNGSIILSFDNGDAHLTFENARSIENGIELYYYDVANNEITKIGNDVQIPVSYDGRLIVASTYKDLDTESDPSVLRDKINNSQQTIITNPLIVHKQTLYVKADDKVRYYGQNYSSIFTEGEAKDSETANRGKGKGYTYSIVNYDDVAYDYGDRVYGYDTAGGRMIADFLQLTYTCKDDPDNAEETDIANNPSYEIDKGKETTVRDIIVNTDAIRDTSPNYTIVPYSENGTLTIRKRPLKITAITGDVPSLTAKYYYGDHDGLFTVPFNTALEDDATGEVIRPAEDPALAFYDGSADSTMTVNRNASDLNSLYNEDPVRIKYYVQYATEKINLDNDEGQAWITENSPYQVTLVTPEMDNTYGKSENYEIDITNSVKTTNGLIYKKRIRDIEVLEPFKTKYTYGEDIDFSKSDKDGTDSAIKITYDSDLSETITFAEAIESYGFNVHYYRNGDYENEVHPGVTGHEEWIQYADNGMQIVITFDGATLDGYQSNGWIYGKTEEEKKVFEVAKHRLRVSSDDVFVTYGNSIDQYGDSTKYTYSYNSADLQHEDAKDCVVRGITAATDPLGSGTTAISGYTAPSIIVYKDNGTQEADIETEAGTYTIHISGAAADNYYFDGCYTEGTLTVRQRPLVVSKIEVPELSQTDAYINNRTKHLVIKEPDASAIASVDGEGETVDAEFASGYGLLSGDTIYITCDAVYPTTTNAGDVKVDIINGKIVELAGTSSRNYYLQNINTPQDGYIVATKIKSIELEQYYDPTNDVTRQQTGTNTYEQKEYKYGDTIDLSTMEFVVEYDNGSNAIRLTYDQLADHNITVWLEDENGTSDKVTDTTITLDNLAYYNDKKLVFKSPEAAATINPDAPSVSTAHSLKVNKHELHVTLYPLSYTYGIIPTEDMVEYSYSGFVLGDSLEDLTADANYVPPTLECTVDGKNIFENRIDVNIDSTEAVIPYENVVKFKENTGSSTNYTFIFDNTEDLTVYQRTLNVTDILEGIPPLSAEDLYNAQHHQAEDENGNPLYDSDGNPIYDPDLEKIYEDQTAEAEKDSSGIYTTKQVEITEPSGDDDLQGLLSGDRVSFSYDAHYDTDPEHTRTDDVSIFKFRLKTMTADNTSANKNYKLDFHPNGSKGEIQRSLITNILVNSDPSYMAYTYGDWFRLSGGEVSIVYNDNHTDTVKFSDLAAHNISLQFVMKGSPDDSIIGDGVVRNNTLLTVSDYNGAYIKLIPDENYIAKDGSGNPMVTAKYTRSPITVSPHIMHVRTKNASMTYGDEPEYDWQGTDGWYYDTTDIVHGDSLTLSTSRFMTDMTPPAGVHAIVSAGSKTERTINDKTPRGTYIITAYGPTEPGEKQNYYFVYESAELTIDPKPIVIESINSLAPVLGADAVFLNGGAVPITVTGGKANYTKDNTEDITFTGNDKVINDDSIAIKYNVEYNDSNLTPRTGVTVSVYNLEFDDTFDNNNNSNYVITGSPQTMSTGEIKEEQIINVEINIDPTLQDDNATSIQYTYGDIIDFNRGFVTVTYDSGLVLNSIPFNRIESLTDNKIKIQYSDGTPAIHNDYLYPSKHNGLTIDFVVDSEKEVTGTLSTKPLMVQKATLTVTAHNATRYYGDVNPVFTYEFSGFVFFKAQDEIMGKYDTVESPNFLEDFVPPIATSIADIKSPIGSGDTYPIVLSGGNSANYDFDFVDAQLTIERRPLDIEAITAGVPTLTSKILRDEPGDIHRLDGTARNTLGQLRLGNFSEGDSIEITYTATYTSTQAAENVTVGIADIAINRNFGEGNNYVLRDITAASNGGTIYNKQISGIQIVNQPKLNYTYGETLDLSGKGVRIEYDDGSVVSDEAFENLGDYGISLTYIDNEGNETVAKNGNKLTLPLHQGVRMHLVPPEELSSISDTYTDPIVMHKKTINITVDNKSLVYGNRVSEGFFTFQYGDDFEYDETPGELIESGDLTPPTCTSLDSRGRAVGATSIVGSYGINASGGKATNYDFYMIPATLRITKRQLVVQSITGGIPQLTADIIRANPGTTHKLEGMADNTQLIIESGTIVNNDDVRIIYNAVYNKEEADNAYDVGIEYVSMDNAFGRSYNYDISSRSATTVPGGGHIYDKEITSIELTRQPRLEYTYGEPLDLSGGTVHIEYDTGFSENITLDQAREHRITLTYTDGTSAGNGDHISVKQHNGQRIILTAQTPHNVGAKSTDALTVNPKVLNINMRSARSTYGEDPTGLLAFDYGNDFVYGENAESLIRDGALGEISVVCFENDGVTAVSETTPAGTYTIIGTPANADNYSLRYNNNTLNIERRPLKITNIKGGIPPLTQTAKNANPEGPYKVEGVAGNSQLEYENLVNDDLIRIKYLAVYENEGDEDVDIEYVSMDDNYARSASYRIDEDSIDQITGGGRYLDKGIIGIEISSMPKLSYTYGDILDLSTGTARVTFETGLTEDITLDKAVEYGILITYDDADNTPANNGDILEVSLHSGKRLVISAINAYDEVTVETDVISVAKRVLEYAGGNIEPIVYDGVTRTTTGTVIFANPQNGDEIATTAVYTFADANAGENKTVYVTNISLENPYSENYTLPSTETTATGTIAKAEITPVLEAGGISISNTTNNITITAPPLTEAQIRGGAKYEYSIDGGRTWQESNVFTNLGLGQECSVCIRIAETSNYKQSASTTPVSVTTYKSLNTNNSGSGGGSGGGTRPVSKPTPTPTSAPQPTSTPEPVETPNPNNGGGDGPHNEPYLHGFENKIRPDDYMTRAEAAALMVILSGDTGKIYPNAFSDVRADTWYVDYISQADARGLVAGFEDGTFHPEETVTREQFAAMVVRMVKLEPVPGQTFKDVDEWRWSAGSINAAVDEGIISGYDDGTFKPENPIRRSEAVRMINVATGRIPDKAIIDTIPCPYTDLPKTHWAYYEFMIASVEF